MNRAEAEQFWKNLSNEDRKALIDALLIPALPNEKLKEAFKGRNKYKDITCGSHNVSFYDPALTGKEYRNMKTGMPVDPKDL